LGKLAKYILIRGETAMRQGAIGSITKYPSLWLLAAAICLCPAAAQALDITSTATGTDALANETSGVQNTADGYWALQQTTSGSYNTATGAAALQFNTTGDSNTATGNRTLQQTTSGSYNTATGDTVLWNNDTGDYNTASGYKALYDNTTGHRNTGSGVYALYSNISGAYNTASGVSALYYNTIGTYNTASGYHALAANTDGSYNTAVGNYALAAINGSNNIALGTLAGKNTTSGNYNIYIGHQGINGSENRVIRIGQGQKKTFIAGISGTALSGATVVVKSNGQLGVVASSARYKQDIAPLGGAASGVAEKLARLRPVSYRYKAEPEATHYGLIAEEVDKVMPELVVRDEQNRPESVQYIELIPLLLQQWKAQQTEIVRQRALIERQAAALTELRQMLATRFAALGAAGRENHSARRGSGAD